MAPEGDSCSRRYSTSHLTSPSSASVALSSSSVLPVERRLKGKASELRAPRTKARTSDTLSRGLNTPAFCKGEGGWDGCAAGYCDVRDFAIQLANKGALKVIASTPNVTRTCNIKVEVGVGINTNSELIRIEWENKAVSSSV